MADYKFNRRTKEEWLQLAQEQSERQSKFMDAEAIENFRSMQASRDIESAYRYFASIAEDEGTIVKDCLFDLEGNYIEARRIETEYGHSWLTVDKKWFNPSKAKSFATRKKNNAKKGFELGRGKFTAHVKDFTVYTNPSDFLERVEVDEEFEAYRSECQAIIDDIYKCELIDIDEFEDLELVTDKIIKRLKDVTVVRKIDEKVYEGDIYFIYSSITKGEMYLDYKLAVKQ